MGSKMAARKAAVPAWRIAFARWAYNKSYFNQIGLMRDDCLYENEDVKEALRRLPKGELDARNFRIARALNLSNQKTILPKEEWTTFDDDVRYLKPFLDQVLKEKAERAEWNKL